MKRAKPKKRHKTEKNISADLLRWYDRHRRILPWRALECETPNPYHVWLSEIMLQQTTVGAVAPYFQKFIARWPSLKDLAKADLDDIMRQWAGLGYYRRARMLHACATTILEKFDGAFPRGEKELLALPGFGPYTVAAVRSIAFNESANVVDGNVERVVARLFAIKSPLPTSKPALCKAAESLLPESRFGDYAQALMDLGATICTPRNPKCDLCPIQKACDAYTLNIAETLPRRVAKSAKPVRHAISFVLYNSDGNILLRKRPPSGLLGGMMEVPSSDWVEGKAPTLNSSKHQAPAALKWTSMPGIVHHVFSHFELQVTVVTGKTSRRIKGHWVAIDKLADEALPSVMRKIIHHAIKSQS